MKAKKNNTSASLGILESFNISPDDKKSTTVKEDINKTINIEKSIEIKDQNNKIIKTNISNTVNNYENNKVKELKSNSVKEESIKSTNTPNSKRVNTQNNKKINEQKNKPRENPTEKRSFMLTEETIKKLGLLDIAIKDKNLSQLVDAAIDLYFTKNKKAVNEVFKLFEDMK